MGRGPADLEQARLTFDRLAGLDERSFLAQLLLGRIAERRQQAGTALEHYARAHDIDAERFERAALSLEYKRRILARAGLIRTAHRLPGTFEEHFDPGPRTGEAPAASDFSSRDEMHRFRGRAPISRAEIAATDLDELMRRLLRGS